MYTANRGSLYVVGVYLPQSGCQVTDYQEHLDVLEYVVEQCSKDGDVVILGDFNAHFGKDVFVRGWGKTSVNGRKLLNMMSSCSLTAADMHEQCKGPLYTFENDQGHCSYIDHCIVPNHCLNDVIECRVLEDLLNSSDHLALMCTIRQADVTVTINEEGDQLSRASKVAWHKLSQEELQSKYTDPLDAKIALITFNSNGSVKNDITKLTDVFEQAVNDVCNDLPNCRYNRHLKPYWNEGLTKSAQKKKQAWHKWVDAGKPRDDNLLWQEYKETKKQFRKDLRRANLETELANLDKIVKTQEIDQRLFWKLINKRRKTKTHTVSPIVNKEGQTEREIGAITKVWKEYYHELYTPVQLDQYDENWKVTVEQAITNEDMTPRDGDSEILSNPITMEEVKGVCRKLKVGKAPGPDGIQAEHLKYAGPIAHKYLARLFCLMTQAEWRPDSMRRGMIVPIPKGNKDPTLPDNNRGITLRSVLGKTYDKILLMRSEEWFQSVCNEQQGANRTACSSLHTALILRENISCNSSKGKTVYTALLDTRKAFDTVWQDGLFYKMLGCNIDRKLWRILKKTYDGFQCSVNIHGNLSEWFHPEQGVHQGDVFSMKLYGVFNDELLRKLKDSGDGATVGQIRCGNPTFADDVAIATVTKQALNRQLDTAFLYSCKWRFSYNANKSLAIVIGEDKRPDMNVKLGEDIVKIVTVGNHLGTPLYSKQLCEKEVVNNRITSCRKCFFSLEGVGATGRGFDPLTLSKLYWAVCVPKLLYGVEIWNVSDKHMQIMEDLHSGIGRRIQRLSPRSARPVSYAMLGWRCIEAYVDVCRLVFLAGLLRLPSTLLVCQLAILRLTECRFETLRQNISSPIYMLYRTALKHGLAQDVHTMLDTGEIPNKNGWKLKVKNVVYSAYRQRWVAECHMYSSLKLFVEIAEREHVSVWWIVCQRNPSLKRCCTIMMKLITGNHNLNTGRRQYVTNTTQCQICNRAEDSVDHMLFICPGMVALRETMWQTVIGTMPTAMAADLEVMNSYQKVVFILSGLKSSYILEWNEIYVSLVKFVCAMYTSAMTLRET